VFLHLNGLSAKAKDLYTEAVQAVESDAIAYSTVTKYHGNDAIWRNEPEAEDRAEIKVSRLQAMQFWRHLK
jgi:hypothetical protein